jgi:hypothetical protein
MDRNIDLKCDVSAEDFMKKGTIWTKSGQKLASFSNKGLDSSVTIGFFN